MKISKITLISHTLCPYVQRAAIVLQEKDVHYERRDVDLANKPEWFLRLSPLGKVPLLLINDDTVLFESAPIAEYVDRISGGGMLSDDPLRAARQRGWVEFASAVIADFVQLYSAGSAAALEQTGNALHAKLATLEQGIENAPLFEGNSFALVDAAFAPVFRLFPVLKEIYAEDFLGPYKKIGAWWETLRARESVKAVVSENYDDLLAAFIAGQQSLLGEQARSLLKSRQEVA